MALFARKVHNYDLFSGHAWYVPGIKGMFGFVGWYLLGALLGAMLLMIVLAFLPNETGTYYGLVLGYPLQFLPAMVFAAYQSRRNMLFDPGYVLDSKHFSPYGMGIVILVTIAMTLASMIVFDAPNWWNMKLMDKLSVRFPFIENWYADTMATMKILLNGPFVISFLVLAVLAPVFEEWLCRGMVLRGLLTKMKPVWAIVISALFFAVIHLNPWQALNAFLIGLLMGYVYYKTGSLLLTMLMHFVNNGTSVVLSHIESMKEYAEVTSLVEVMNMSTYLLVIAVSCIVLAASLWAFSRIKVENPWGNIDRIPPADAQVAAETMK